ncbi:hypothetical protein [Streptodolium elevatio]
MSATPPEIGQLLARSHALGADPRTTNYARAATRPRRAPTATRSPVTT